MKLTCKRCKTEIEIPPDPTSMPDARIECPGCKARYRLRPRTTPAPSATAAPSKSLTPATERYQVVRFLAQGGIDDLEGGGKAPLGVARGSTFFVTLPAKPRLGGTGDPRIAGSHGHAPVRKASLS